MSEQNDYESTLAAFSALPVEELKACPMPVVVYLGEAEDLWQRADKDFEQLSQAGLARQWLDDLKVRCGALRHAQSIWLAEFNAKKDAQSLWAETAPQAYTLRDDLLHNFRYALRRDEAATQLVKRIAEGESHRDMIQDLSTLSVLGKKHTEALSAVGFDLALLDTAATTADDMASLLAAANGNKQDGHTARVLRDQAYNYLKQAVDEVRDCGKFVFHKKPNHLKFYMSDYYNQSNHRE